MSIRGLLYLIARIMGDISAIRRRRVGQRIYNRLLGRFFTRFFK